MNERELKQKIIRVYKYKSISNKQYNMTLKNIEYFKDSDPLFYNLNMGKFLTAFGDFNKAIFYLENASKYDNTKSVIYYNLYKCYVRKGDIPSAYINLCKCMEYEKKEVNFAFSLSLMNVIMDIDSDFDNSRKTFYAVPESDHEGYNELDDDSLVKLHRQLLELFNQKEYFKCCDVLNLMNERIQEINYPMEVETLKILANILKQKISSNYAFLLRNEKLGNVSVEEYSDIVMQMHSLGYVEEVGVLRKIDNLFNKDYLKAKTLLDRVSSDSKFDDYKDMIEYLKGIAREKEEFVSLDDEICSEYFSLKRHARSLFDRRKYKEALELYNEAKEITGLSVCDYYIAKTLFKSGRLFESEDCFLNYLSHGGVKTEKALLYLGLIEGIKKHKSTSKKYFKKMQRIHEVFDRNFVYIERNSLRQMTEDEIIDSNDRVKEKNMRRIHMREVDFIQEDKMLSIDDFYDTDINGKLSIIKHLYQTGTCDVANKLIEEVQRECATGERKKVKQFIKNKKIYMNQRRTTS